jgi:PAS domain S-box-containing protein
MTQPDEVTTLKDALRAAEAKLALLRDATPYVVYVYDLAGRRTEYLNRHLGLELGYDRDEIQELGEALLTRLVHPDDLARFPELFARWDLVEDGEVLETEYRARHKDGSYRYFLGRDVVYERDAEGRVRRFLGTAVDVTERKLLEQRVSQAEKLEALGRMASGIAHDFNNLVAIVLGSLSLVERQLHTGGAIEGHLAHVRAAAEQAAKVTSQLLEFARPGLPSPAYADLADTIHGARPVLERILAPNCKLEIELADVLPPVAIAANALVPVLVNLVVNARDAIKESGSVTIRARVIERTVRANAEGRVHTTRLRAAHGRGRRRGHLPGRRAAHLRAFLHHEGPEPRHGPRPRDRVHDRQARGWRHRRGQPRGRRHALRRLLTDRSRARAIAPVNFAWLPSCGGGRSRGCSRLRGGGFGRGARPLR